MNDTPNSDEAERGFLGSVLLASTRLDKNSYLESDWFSETKHKTVFTILKKKKKRKNKKFR